MSLSKICEIPEKKHGRSAVRGCRYFLIFQPNDMLNLCLNKRNAEQKRVYLHSSKTQTIVEMQAFLLMKN